MNKNYVLDTNVLLSDDDCLDKLCTGGNLVHIPIVCLEELDRHKSRPDEVGKNARAIARKIDGYRKEGSLAEGITLPSGGTLRVVSCDFETYVPEGLDPTKVDNKIIGCAFYLKREIAQWDRESNPKIRDRVLCLVATGMNKDAALLEAVQQTEESADVTLISQDINVRLKCDSVGIPAEDYKASHVTVKNDSLYSGVTRISVDDPAIIDQLYFNVKKSQSACHSLFQNPEYDLRPNEICVVKYEDAVTHASQSAMVRVLDPELGTYKIIIERKNQNVVFGLSQKNKEQGFALDLLLDPNVSLVTLAGTAGTGKAQPLDAKLLTPTGWKLMGDIRVGDQVIGSNGKPTTVTGVFPQGEKDIYRVAMSDGSATECCDDHLWQTHSSKERDTHSPPVVRSLSEIRKSLVTKNKKRNYSIPMVAPVEFHHQEVPIDPYVLGVLLGDGTMSRGSVYLSSTDQEIVSELNSLLVSNNCTLKRAGETIDYRLNKIDKSVPGILQAVQSLGLEGKKSNEKFIPDIYLFNSEENRIRLLRGLMDTDGFVSKNGHDVVFYSTSRQLAEGVQFLVQSFGGKAVICNRQTSYTHNGEKRDGLPSFAVRISVPASVSVVSIERKLSRVVERTKYPPKRYIDEVTYVGRKQAQCISVAAEDHLYVTDDFIVTHNTLIAIAAGLQQVLESNIYTKMIITRPIEPVGRDVGFLPGTAAQKMSPWVAPIRDNLEFLCAPNSKGLASEKKEKGDKDKKGSANKPLQQPDSEDFSRNAFVNTMVLKGQIEVEAVTFIRGRSFPKCFIIVDEAQNLTLHQLKTIITRSGEGSKIVLTGDLSQIDVSSMDALSSGFTHAIEKFKDYPIAGHITLLKGERSELATLAADLL